MKSSPELSSVTPVRPAAGYIGGKRNLAKRLVERIGRVPHRIYAEPFVGMGGVFLRRTSRPRTEVINDWSMDVATFFRILQRHYVAFMDMLRFQLTTRAGFERLMKVDPATLTDLERAARFLYLQRAAFGGKVAGRSFDVSPTTSARFDVTKLGPILEALHDRLAGVVIERLHWREFIERYDRPDALFYLDPPYWGSESDYGEELFSAAEWTEMTTVLARLKGRFIMSLNDAEQAVDNFSDFAIERVQTTYSLARAQKLGKRGELIISGPKRE